MRTGRQEGISWVGPMDRTVVSQVYTGYCGLELYQGARLQPIRDIHDVMSREL